MSKRVSLYIIVSFGFSWAIAALIWYLSQSGAKGAAYLMFPYMMGPGLAGLLCAWRFNKGHRASVLGFTGGWNIWLLWAWLIGLGLVIGATALSLLAPDVGLQAPVNGMRDVLAAQNLDAQTQAMAEAQLSLPFINLILLAQGVLLGAAINTPLMLSEELGWRGWLWHELRPKGFWPATVWIGLLWGLWHIPIIVMGHNYPGMPVWGPILFTAYCILYAPLYSYIREKNGSIWGPCALHGTGNAVAGIGIMMQTNADMPWRGVVGFGGFIMVSLATLWVYYRVKGNTVVTANP